MRMSRRAGLASSWAAVMLKEDRYSAKAALVGANTVRAERLPVAMEEDTLDSRAAGSQARDPQWHCQASMCVEVPGAV